VKHLQLPVILIFIVSLSGCIGGTSPETRFYLLKPINITSDKIETTSSEQISIGIKKISLPGYIDRTQIITRTDSHLIELGDYDHWAQSLDENMMQVILEQMMSLRQDDNVVAYPWSRHQKHDIQININILRFEGQLGGLTHLKGTWMILDGRGNDIKETHRFNYTIGSESSSYESLVLSMSTLISQLTSDLNHHINVVASSK